MANETSQARNNAPQIPERTLRIDGERTAAMYTLSIRVARLDTRLRELAGNPTVEGRKQYRLGNEAFARLLGEFEDGLMQVEKDVDMNSRRGNRQGKAQPQRREPQSRSQVVPQKQTAAPAATSTAAAESKSTPHPKEPKASTAPAVEPIKGQAQQPKQPAQKPPQQNGQQPKGQQPKGQQPKPKAKNPQQPPAKQKADVATVTL